MNKKSIKSMNLLKFVRLSNSDSDIHSVYFYGYDRDSNTYLVQVDWQDHKLKGHYRRKRTLDDYFGNTPCGTYVIVPIGRSKHRVYLYD